MTKTSGAFVRLGVLAVLFLAGVPSLARAEVLLATGVASRYPDGGGVKCSAVNVGDDPLDITVSLIDVSTGAVEITKACTGDATGANPGAVPPNQRCAQDSTSTAVVFCKITVDIKGGSSAANPATAVLRQQVRANIISYSAGLDAFSALAAQ